MGALCAQKSVGVSRNHALWEVVEGMKEEKTCDILVILCIYLMDSHGERGFSFFLSWYCFWGANTGNMSTNIRF